MRIVFAGDSITASGTWDGCVPGGEVINVAVPGYTTADLVRDVPMIVGLAPNVLVVLIGTNDLGGLDRDPDDVAHDIVGIVEALAHRLPGTRIILNAVMPRDPFWTPSITRINERLANLAHPQLTYLDTWPALASADGAGLDPRYLLDDGFDVHLNEHAYQVWKSLLSSTITPVEA